MIWKNWNIDTELSESQWYSSTLRIEKNPYITPEIKETGELLKMRTRGVLDWAELKFAIASDSDRKVHLTGIQC